MKIYVDTNVYLDYFLDRRGKVVPWSDFAFDLFRRTCECEFEVVVSDILLMELTKLMDVDEEFVVSEIQEITNGKITKVESHGWQRKKARMFSKKSGIPLADVLHSLIAMSAGAVVITRDEHFEILKTILPKLKTSDPRMI